MSAEIMVIAALVVALVFSITELFRFCRERDEAREECSQEETEHAFTRRRLEDVEALSRGSGPPWKPTHMEAFSGCIYMLEEIVDGRPSTSPEWLRGVLYSDADGVLRWTDLHRWEKLFSPLGAERRDAITAAERARLTQAFIHGLGLGEPLGLWDAARAGADLGARLNSCVPNYVSEEPITGEWVDDNGMVHSTTLHSVADHWNEAPEYDREGRTPMEAARHRFDGAS